MRSTLGPLVVALGVAVAVIGVLIWTGALSWFGRLPGDIRIVSRSTRIYIPLTSMLLVSVVGTVVVNVLRRLPWL